MTLFLKSLKGYAYRYAQFSTLALLLSFLLFSAFTSPIPAPGIEVEIIEVIAKTESGGSGSGNDITLAPNPADTHVSVTLEEGVSFQSLRVISATTGAVVYSGTVPGGRVYIADVTAGVWVIEVTTNLGVTSKQLVKV